MDVSMPINRQFRVHSAEGLGNVAVPADGLEVREDLEELLGAKLVPFRRDAIRSDQGGGMIKVLEPLERLLAKNAVLPFVPLRDDIPEQAILGICFHLLQALLAAVLALGPS